MADFDVVVIGGGPAGYTAALKAAERGASVALVEAEKPGGACVHYACIPTNILLSSAVAHIEARELAVHGVFDAGDAFNFARAVARKDALVGRLAQGIAAALRMRKVRLVPGRASFTGPDGVSVAGENGEQRLSAGAFIVATGARWESPAFTGVPPERVLTADAVQRLAVAPVSALVLGGGPADTVFALEYAFLLAAAGAEVSLATPAARLLPSVDSEVAEVALGMLAAAGVRLFDGATLEGTGDRVTVRHATGVDSVPAEVVVVADARRPHVEGLGLERAGIRMSPAGIGVDSRCQAASPRVFAAGDVTGQVMLSSTASHMGEVAAVNATGGSAHLRLGSIPHLLHGLPEIGWVGITAEQAKASAHDVLEGSFDLSFNARSLVLGAREGLVKVVAERELGQILGVHAVGSVVPELVNLAAGLMQAEVSVHDLAAMTLWHPSMAEGLVEAARRAIGS